MLLFIRHIDKILISLLCWIPYFIYIYHNTSNIPFNDDYDLYLKSLLEFNDSNSVKEQIRILFSQHMEHRPAIPRIIAFFEWKLVGNLNFRALILLGNFFLYLHWVLFICTFKSPTKLQSLIYGLAIFFILTGLQSIENMIWATGSIQNYSFSLFTCLSLYFATKKKYAIGIIWWVLALFCNISAMVIAPVILIVMISQTNLRTFIGTALFMALICVIYFIEFSFPAVDKFPGLIPDHSLFNKMNYFLAFLGSSLTIGDVDILVSILAGIILLILLLFWNRKISNWNYLTAIAIVIVLFAFMGVLFRSVFGAHQALAERYRIYSEILVICVITQIMLSGKFFKYIILALSIMQFIYLFNFYNPKVKSRKTELEAGYIYLVFFKNPENIMHPSPAYAADKLIQSYEQGIFKP